MSSLFLRWCTVYAILLSLPWAAPSDASESENNIPPRPVVFVSIPPQAWLVEELAGDWVQVETLLPARGNHELYEPAPSQMRALARAELFIRIGLPFENRLWDDVRAANRTMRILDATAGIARRQYDHHDHDAHGDGDRDNDSDPHVWLDPGNMITMTRNMSEALAELLPEQAESIRVNRAQLMALLMGLHARLEQQLTDVPQRTFWVFHPSWGYFADAYALEQRAIEPGGREAGAKSLAEIVAHARDAGVRTLFVEPSVIQQAQTIAAELGADLVEVNPLSGDYPGTLQQLAEAIAEAGVR